MLIMNRRLVEDKVNTLLEGYSAYAETQEIIRLIKRDIAKHNISVVCDETESGCWFIPQSEIQST
ncbi:hypothetical protein NC797_05655 [Aquibacillus sp. 3ASR75-11]|uniref:Uncharacterized protein n=1 Tax=Terrihalobacillus insolitus TaxID=2950438 RepID=A0A9X3WQE5_9BACI|nr:hypothetical protein [Terrihalobacillus insolitus]MDC3412642.1 hypothetical protein [Terrihalobacillus insolitus]MDC3423992.1 hypothetical protein [Terrihalobacillus insolitus]